MSPSIKEIRQTMRSARRGLKPLERKQKNRALCTRLTRLILSRRHTHIAAYLSDRGEADLTHAVQAARAIGRKIYLPVLHPIHRDKMIFVEHSPDIPLIKNRFGIPEPQLGRTRTIPARFLGAAMCPLVAFDEQGNRLGMGGGFYDRSFAFKQSPGQQSRPPKLIGVAFDLQKVDQLPSESWDIQMSVIVTDKACYQPRKNC